MASCFILEFLINKSRCSRPDLEVQGSSLGRHVVSFTGTLPHSVSLHPAGVQMGSSYVMLGSKPAMDKPPFQQEVAILLVMLHDMETGIRSNRLGLWPILLKKGKNFQFLTKNHGLTPLEKCKFSTFLNHCFSTLKWLVFYPQGYKTRCFDIFHCNRKRTKFPIFDHKP